jgi:catechol 2,3-dioxygenase-like lactoylglutathione lyase family enzyme
MIAGVHHVAISTGDLDRLLRFYRDTLGLEVRFEQTWSPGNEKADAITGLCDSSARQVLLAAGNAYVELFEFRSPPPRPGDPDRLVCDHGITHLCLDVADLDAEYQRLSAGGVRFHAPPQDLGRGVRTTYARDPDGNVVELQELTAEHPFATARAAPSPAP